ncbi:hypothetical protein H6G17_21495 [Chroococcidiopsis sp. FACHB-1243]|nr:hypothetical protein [Chroococcidiopsis sp. [FACHB-1243]]MBD2308050.1 hypothetical protein [Chroococcidiopsis sp. [FACHB-1243]]
MSVEAGFQTPRTGVGRRELRQQDKSQVTIQPHTLHPTPYTLHPFFTDN